MTSDLLYIWMPSQHAASIGIWVAIVIGSLYTARVPMHTAILTLTGTFRRILRLMAHTVMMAEAQLVTRNREVLIAHGREAIEGLIEREFHRVEDMVSRDLGGYPSLQRDLKDELTRIDDDYLKSGEVPSSPPAWLDAVKAVAEIPSDGSPVVAKLLEDIHQTLRKALDRETLEARDSNKQRHHMLKNMMPHWREVAKILSSVDKKIVGLDAKAGSIDEQMDRYEQIVAGSDEAQRRLSSSSLTQFFVSGLVLFIAIVGGYVNFQLVALPMSEMVGASSYIGSIRSSDIAALFIISVEVSLGLFFMESVGVTKLFPVISQLDDRKRRIIMFATLAFLIIFACIESSLAYMRDLLAADAESLTKMLLGVDVKEPEFRWIPSVAQMVMGFILPFVLTFVAIPLESFIHSSRTVLGLILMWLLRSLAFLIRVVGTFVHAVGSFIVSVYDLVIFLPLSIERLVRPSKRPPRKRGVTAKMQMSTSP